METVILILLALAFGAMQVLIGGARLSYAMPCYLLLAVAGLASLGLWKRRPLVAPSPACLLSTLALGAYLLIRNRLSPVEYLARPDFLLILGGLVVYFTCAVQLSGTRDRLALLWILLLLGVVHFALGVFQFKDLQNFMLLPGIYRPDFGFRASGFYITPNHLACLLGTLAMVALSICCWSRGEFSTRAFAYYGFVGCVSGILLTGSRIGYLSTAAGLGAFAVLSFILARYFNRPNFLGVAAALGFLLACLAGTALMFIMNGEFFEQRVRHVHDAPVRPSELWPAAHRQIALAPIFGTGAGTTRYLARKFRAPTVRNDPEHAHNDYLELLGEYGWVGGGLAATFLSVHLFWAAAGLRRVLEQKLKPAAWTSSNELALLLGALCGIVVLLVQSGRDFSLHLPGNALLAAFLFAILANPTFEATPSNAPNAPPRLWTGLAGPVAAGILLIALLPTSLSAWRGERARIALRDGQYSRAESQATDALRGDSRNPELYYYLGEARRYLALEAGDAAAATAVRTRSAEAFAAGLQVFPQDVNLLLKLGRVRDQLRQFAEAEESYLRALQADPYSGVAAAYYALHFHIQRQLKQAREWYRKAEQLGETTISSAGLRDLVRDEAITRANNPFADLLPEEDRPLPSHSAPE